MGSVAATATDHTTFTPASASAGRRRQPACSQLIIHGMPKRSTTIPKPADQNVFSNGILTVPFSDRALNVRSASSRRRQRHGDVQSRAARCNAAAARPIPCTTASPDLQPGVNDLVVPVGRHVFLHRRLAVRLHHDDAAVEAALVEFKGGRALAVEIQIRIDIHQVPLSASTHGGSPSPSTDSRASRPGSTLTGGTASGFSVCRFGVVSFDHPPEEEVDSSRLRSAR